MWETWVRFLGLISGLGRSPGEGNGYPLQHSGLENSIDFIIHVVAESDMMEQLSHIIYVKYIYIYVCVCIYIYLYAQNDKGKRAEGQQGGWKRTSC